ncbi:unnamed protein product [Amoebophrya sp. A120]|nr:unnamed protein product [Amoebophrya sp. A120]|eukprot:GSA120T00016362001.1
MALSGGGSGYMDAAFQQSRRGGETITLQLGPAANHAGVHFWNLEAATYHVEAMRKVENSSNGTTTQSGPNLYHDLDEKTDLYYPRVIAVDDKGASGGLNCEDGTSNFVLKEDSRTTSGLHVASQMEVEQGESFLAPNHDDEEPYFERLQKSFHCKRVEQDAIYRHPYSRLGLAPIGEEEDAWSSGSEISDGEEHHNIGKNYRSANYQGNPSPRKVRRMTPHKNSSISSGRTQPEHSELRYWSDYLLLDYLPKYTFYERQNQVGCTSGAAGAASSSTSSSSTFERAELDAIEDRYVRKALESCDRLDTAHLFADTARLDYSDLAVYILQYLREEQPKLCTVGVELFDRGGSTSPSQQSSSGTTASGTSMHEEAVFRYQDLSRARFLKSVMSSSDERLLDCFFPCELDKRSACRSTIQQRTPHLFHATADIALAAHSMLTSFSPFFPSSSTFWRSFEFVTKELFAGSVKPPAGVDNVLATEQYSISDKNFRPSDSMGLWDVNRSLAYARSVGSYSTYGDYQRQRQESGTGVVRSTTQSGNRASSTCPLLLPADRDERIRLFNLVRPQSAAVWQGVSSSFLPSNKHFHNYTGNSSAFEQHKFPFLREALPAVVLPKFYPIPDETARTKRILIETEDIQGRSKCVVSSGPMKPNVVRTQYKQLDNRVTLFRRPESCSSSSQGNSYSSRRSIFGSVEESLGKIMHRFGGAANASEQILEQDELRELQAHFSAGNEEGYLF